MENKEAKLLPDATYHIYNRANGNESFFLSKENYSYFLNKYSEYILPFTSTYCYCLMPNHFHFIIRIKSEDELKKLISFKNPNPDLIGFQNLSGLDIEALISKQFSNFFNAYSKAFNKQQKRKGSLFMRPFKRKKVENENYLKKLVHYIHFNPVEAGLSSAPGSWRYSSYNAIISDNPSLLDKQEVIKWFDDLDNFMYVHQHSPRYTGIDGFS